MECPRDSNHGVEQFAVRLYIIEEAQKTVDADRQKAVEREEIGSERDEKIAARVGAGGNCRRG